MYHESTCKVITERCSSTSLPDFFDTNAEQDSNSSTKREFTLLNLLSTISINVVHLETVANIVDSIGIAACKIRA